MKTLTIGLFIVALAGHPGAAQDLPTVLYHAQDSTVGCANPMMTRTLTNPRERRRRNAAWMKENMLQGRCVSLTTQSPWKLILVEGDVALMSYAGSVGPPGAYYLRVAEMIDSSGHHPGDIPVAAPPQVTPPATAAAEPPAQTDTASATALAPRPEAPLAPPGMPVHHNGVIWVSVIGGLAILAIVVVVALQAAPRQKPR